MKFFSTPTCVSRNDCTGRSTLTSLALSCTNLVQLSCNNHCCSCAIWCPNPASMRLPRPTTYATTLNTLRTSSDSYVLVFVAVSVHELARSIQGRVVSQCRHGDQHESRVRRSNHSRRLRRFLRRFLLTLTKLLQFSLSC